MQLCGFTFVRPDRGGGVVLILHVNYRWCNPYHLTVKDTLYCRDLELLAVSLRQYYLPREFTHIFAVCVYIPPRADVGAACEMIHTSVAQLQTQHPKAHFFQRL